MAESPPSDNPAEKVDRGGDSWNYNKTKTNSLNDWLKVGN